MKIQTHLKGKLCTDKYLLIVVVVVAVVVVIVVVVVVVAVVAGVMVVASRIARVIVVFVVSVKREIILMSHTFHPVDFSPGFASIINLQSSVEQSHNALQTGALPGVPPAKRTTLGEQGYL